MSHVLDVENFSQRHTTERYPNIEIANLNDTVPLVMSLLEPGTVQVIGSFRGQRKVLASISSSAFNIDKLLKTGGVITYTVSAMDQKVITKIEDYLEVFQWI